MVTGMVTPAFKRRDVSPMQDNIIISCGIQDILNNDDTENHEGVHRLLPGLDSRLPGRYGNEDNQ